MAKKRETTFFCSECGYESSKWLGQCPECKAWNSFVEEKIVDTSKVLGTAKPAEKLKPISLSDVVLDKEEKIKTGFSELDNALGGGIVKGSLVLIGGAPGIGKSTLLLQICSNIEKDNKKVIYVSGEESLKQIKLRADRICTFTDKMKFLNESNVASIYETMISEKPDLLIIDSIQTMKSPGNDGMPGSVSQVKEASEVLFRLAKENGIAIIIVGHITKEGTVAGPKILEHMVDTVLYFEDDWTKNFRLLRCKKNRFGSVNEIAVFEMGNKGLTQVENASEIFLAGRPTGASGCVVTCIVEGRRPMLMEIQSLVCKSNYGMARRTVNGVDHNRLAVLIAIIEKRLNIDLSGMDVLVSITGGVRSNEPSIDLAIIVAIISSYKNVPTEPDAIYCGEVGLSGEVRSITNADIRIMEAKKLGYKKIFIPKANVEKMDDNLLSGIEVKPVSTILS